MRNWSGDPRVVAQLDARFLGGDTPRGKEATGLPEFLYAIAEHSNGQEILEMKTPNSYKCNKFMKAKTE